jgi:hypothetical protein
MLILREELAMQQATPGFDWVGFVKDIAIPFITVGAAFLGARWGRNNALRERLYDKQIEAYSQLTEHAGNIFQFIHITSNIYKNKQTNNEEYQHHLNEMNDLTTQLLSILWRNQLYIDSNFRDIIVKFCYISRLLLPILLREHDKKDKETLIKNLVIIYNQLIIFAKEDILSDRFRREIHGSVWRVPWKKRKKTRAKSNKDPGPQ